MSDETAWGWSREQKTKDIVIYDNADDDDHSDVILADGAYLSEEDAALIVRDHNAHDALVEALEVAATGFHALANPASRTADANKRGRYNAKEHEAKLRAALEEAK